MSLEKWAHYLEVKSFVVTDHSSLLWAFNTMKASWRPYHWALRLQGFSFTIEYCVGKLNNACNALWQAIIPASLARDKNMFLFPWPMGMSGSSEEPSSIPENCTRHSGFVILEDKVYQKTSNLDWGDLYQVYVPDSLHSVFLQAYHDNPLNGHFRLYKTQQRILEVAKNVDWCWKACQVRNTSLRPGKLPGNARCGPDGPIVAS